MHLAELAQRVGPILGFLVAITVVAELADGIGVFAAVARAASRLARGSILALWLLVVLVAVLSTAVLSLDTTAVLLTPVVLTLATRLGLDRGLFAYTAVWLANTASLFLPVSNLTNLLAVRTLSDARPGFDAIQFAMLLGPAAIVSVLVTVGALMIIFRHSLRGRYLTLAPDPVHHRPLLIMAMVVCAALGPAFLAGINVFVAAAIAAAILIVGCLRWHRSLLRWQLVPWKLVLGVSVMFVVVQFAHDHGLGAALTAAVGQGHSWAALLRLGGLGALGANVLDNLPTYLALEPAAGSPERLAALLVGVGAGPLITPWASLATLLWAARCRSGGVSISWSRFALRGLIVVPVLLVASVTALWAVQSW